MEFSACSVIAYPIDAVPAIAGVTRTQVFDAIREQELTARKCGRRTLIEADELRRWVSTFPMRGRMPNTGNAAA
jgi:hypothetical protein